MARPAARKKAAPKSTSKGATVTQMLTTPGSGGRRAFVSRATKETRIAAAINLDGTGKYDIKTGQVVQHVEFEPGSSDIHDVTVYNGQLYGVDAGEHPGWSIDKPAYQHPGFPPLNSPSGGTVFKIDLI